MSDEELIQVANEVRKGVVIGTHAGIRCLSSARR